MPYIGYQPPDRFNSSFKRENFTGNGTMGPFILELAVVDGSEQGIELFVGNVRQEPTVAYTIGGSGNNLNKELLFTESPEVGETIYLIHKGDTTAAIGIPDGYITNNKLADNAVTQAKTSFLKSSTDTSAIYEINDSTTKGVILAPKMTESQRDAISSPATSLVIYNTTTNKLNSYNGTIWVTVSGIADVVADTSPQLGGTLDFNGQKFTNHILPSANATYDIGSAEFKIRDIYVDDNTIYMGDSATIKAEGTAIVVQDLKTGDLHLDNTKRNGNSVDGTNGSWTFQEGATDMYLLNNVTGKKYKINLTEI